MHDVGVAPRQQPKGPARTDHIHRLPQAIEDQNRLVKHGIHDEAGS
jgi:hypothetical protein